MRCDELSLMVSFREEIRTSGSYKPYERELYKVVGLKLDTGNISSKN